EAVDRAEGELAALRALARAGNLVEQPGDLRAREIGIEQESRAFAHERLGAAGLEACADVGRAPVLPDDRTMNGPTGRAVPHDGGLALVRDADGRDAIGADARLCDGLMRSRKCVAPDVLGVVLHPAGCRVVLRELAPRERDDAALAVENDAARR